MTAQPISVESIFSAALEIASLADRAAYLDRACSGDATLRARVEALLKADADAGSFLDKPPAGLDATVDGTADGTDGNDSGALASDLSFLAPCDKPGRMGVLRGKAGEYEVVELVGRGGMGAVLRAVDTKLNRVVAVKVMAPELGVNPTAVKRFLREAQAAAAIHHDHVVTIYAVDDEHRPSFLVMEFIDGETLGQKIEREGALGLVKILRIGSQIAAGLAAAHKHGLIHRDVKPGNILLENGVERVKITDFGLARAADDLEMTQSGLIAGTPQYMAPEQAKGEVIDVRSDLFSMGSVLYAMCTGRPAFRAETTMGVLRRVCDDTPRPITQVNPDIPSWLEGIVDKLLAKDPADRFQTAKEVADLLAHHLAHEQNRGQAPSKTTVKLTPRRRSRLRFYGVVAAAGVLLLLCASVLFNWQYLRRYFSNLGAITSDENEHVSRILVKDETQNRFFTLRDGETTEYWAGNYVVRAQSEFDIGSYDGQFRELASNASGPLELNTNYRIRVRPGETLRLRFAKARDQPPIRRSVDSNAGSRAQGTPFPPGSSADILTSQEWEWTKAENLGPAINSVEIEKEPSLSTDGRTLLFSSRRDVALGRMYVSTRASEEEKWSPPVVFPIPHGRGGDSGTSLSSDGLALIYTFWASGDTDLYGTTRASFSGPWNPSVNLGPAVNSPEHDVGPCLSTDGLKLLFSSGGVGKRNLFVCHRDDTASPWSHRENLGPNVNSSGTEEQPWISHDELTLLFHTKGDGGANIAQCARASSNDEWSPRTVLESPISSGFADIGPCLSGDCKTLVFASNRPGGHGNFDLWMSRRVRKQKSE